MIHAIFVVLLAPIAAFGGSTRNCVSDVCFTLFTSAWVALFVELRIRQLRAEIIRGRSRTGEERGEGAATSD